MEDKVKIKRKLKPDLIFIASCLGFVLAGLYMIFKMDYSYWLLGFSNRAVNFWGWFSVAFFGGGLLVVLVSGVFFRPIAEIDKIGITLFSNWGRKKTLYWKDGIQKYGDSGNQKGILIKSKDDFLIIPTKDAGFSFGEIIKILNTFKKQYDAGEFDQITTTKG